MVLFGASGPGEHLIHELFDPAYYEGLMGGYLHITKQTVDLWWVSGLCLLLVMIVSRWYQRQTVAIPQGVVMNAFEAFVLYVRDNMVYQIMGEEKGRDYLSFILTLFVFLLVANFMGLVPPLQFAGYVIWPGGAIMGNPWIALGLASFVFGIGIVAGIREHGFMGYLGNYVPHGVPWYAWPIIWPIEVVGMVIKHAVLAVRILANMVAGHAVLFGILVGAVTVVEILRFQWFGLGVLVSTGLTIAVAVAVYLLEIIIAAVQAFIFTILTVVFLDMQVSEH